VPPRVRDLVACLAAPVGKDHETVAQLVNYFTVQAHLIKEPLPFPQDVVLAALFFKIHERDAELIFVGDLTGEVNRLLEESGSRVRLKPRRVGHILSVLGFSERRRTREGWGVSLILPDQERLHKLVRSHGIDVPPNLRAFTAGCRLCECTS